MKKLGRSLLFGIFALLFITAAPTAILYSQGWRFDFESNDFVKTGGLFIRTNVPARISINGKFKKKTGAWTSSAFFRDLLPKNYKIEVTKAGFHSWKKNLRIKEEEVTEAKYIILFPKNPELSLIEEKVDNFYSLPNKNSSILKKQENNQFALYLYNENKGTTKEIFRDNASLMDLKVGPDSQRILLETKSGDSVTYSIISFGGETISSFPLDFLPSDVKEVHFHPQDSNRLFVHRSKPEPVLVTTNHSSESPTFENVISNFLDYEISNNNIIWLSSEGFAFRSDLSGDINDTLNFEPLEINGESNYEITSNYSDIFIKQDSNLFWLKSEEKEFKHIFKSIKPSQGLKETIKFSPDNQKLAINTGHELWTLFLNEKYNQPQKEKGDKVFLTRLSKEIEDFSWLDSNYLTFRVKDKIKVVGIDDRGQINAIDLLEPESCEKVSWNDSDHKFHLLRENQLYSSEVLFR